MNEPAVQLKFRLTTLFVFGLVLALQWFRINHLAPAPEYIWDNVYLWDWARDVAEGNFTNFVSESHHQLRWGNWGFAAIMIAMFSDEVLYYYLSTVIPSTLAILVFTFLSLRYLGLFAAILFVIFWFFDALLFRATFQLLPSGAGLLPLAILTVLCLHVVRSKHASTSWLVAIALTVFWLYGVKETFLAFVPGALWLVFKALGGRPVLIILGVAVLAYVGESIAFSLISNDFSAFGRIHSIISGGQHIQLMTENIAILNRQTQYFDSGLTMRWVLTSGVTPLAIFTGFIFALLIHVDDADSSDDSPTWDMEIFVKVLATLAISFVVFTTFFVVSINPIRLGQPVNPRYATTLMPLIYIIIIGYLVLRLKVSKWPIKMGVVSIIPFYIAPAIDRYSDYPDYSIYKISESYNSFSQELAKYECIRAKQRVIVLNQLDLIPTKYRTPQLQKLIDEENLIEHNKPWVIVNPSPEKTPCKSLYTIHRNVTMRY